MILCAYLSSKFSYLAQSMLYVAPFDRRLEGEGEEERMLAVTINDPEDVCMFV